MDARNLPVEGWGFYNLDEDQYHRDPAPKPSMSSSFLATIITETVAVAHDSHPRLQPTFGPIEGEDEGEPDNKKFDVGKIAHALVLGKGKRIVPVDAKDWKKKADQEERKRIIEDGDQPCLLRQMLHAERMRDALMHQLAEIPGEQDSFLPDMGFSEQGGFWQEQTQFGKLWARALIDWRHKDRLQIRDYKTYNGQLGSDPEAFVRGIIDGGKDIQDPHYSAAYAAIAGAAAGEVIPWDAVDFAFIVQDPNPPYLVSVVRLQDRLWSFERRHWAIDRWAASVGAGMYRGHAPIVHQVPPPAYARTKWEMRMIREWEAEQALAEAGRKALQLQEPETYRIPDDDDIQA
jgi:hypothetical protein